MKSCAQAEGTQHLQMQWNEQFFKEIEQDLEQGDLRDTLQNVLFYASLLYQRQQALASGVEQSQTELPLSWMLESESEIVTLVKSVVPTDYHPVLEYSLQVEGSSTGTSSTFPSEAELRAGAAAFIRYAQWRLRSSNGYIEMLRRGTHS
jgi:hypothetical protein